MSHQDEQEQRGDRPPASINYARLLLIGEAEERATNLYQSVLEQAGYEVIVVPHEEAGAASRKAGPALVILQLVDPTASGLGLVRELRTQADTRGTPVIVLTRFDDAYTREQIVRAGATAILLEPVKTPMLLRQLRRLLARTVMGAAFAAAHAEKLTVTPVP
jgi:two-component system phosphate regulon response regulator PhoB